MVNEFGEGAPVRIRRWFWTRMGQPGKVDRRLIVIFLLLVFVGSVVLYRSDRAVEALRRQQEVAAQQQRATATIEKQVIQNCLDQNTAYAKVNDLLERLAVSATMVTTRTPEQNQIIADQYRGFKLFIQSCPPPN